MKVKKYAAPTMPEVMKQIRNELGSEAVILNSRKVKYGGILGLKKKNRIEVVAALDPEPLRKEVNKEMGITRKSAPFIEHVKPDSSSNKQVLDELHLLKKMVHQSAMNKYNYPAEYQLLYTQLLEQEITEPLAKKILDKVLDYHEEENISPVQQKIQQDVKSEILNQLNELSIQGIASQNKIMHFVGPTGVGKTTTIAKIAASNVLKKGKKVALITTDTYRIAAIEQLKTYANILRVPIKVAYTKDDYIQAVHQFADYDYILVDTAGRNFREQNYVRELVKSIDSHFPIDMYLVLSLTAKAKDTLELYDQFKHLPIKQVVFTKIDETQQYGSMLNLTLERKIGIAFITNGQDVPDDLIEATPELIADYCTGGIPHE
jgi:flagellar biosynthesis protein FlhF